MMLSISLEEDMMAEELLSNMTKIHCKRNVLWICSNLRVTFTKIEQKQYMYLFHHYFATVEEEPELNCIELSIAYFGVVSQKAWLRRRENDAPAVLNFRYQSTGICH